MKHGTVVLLDILGTKNMSDEDRVKFVMNLRELLDELDTIKNDFNKMIPLISTNLEKLQSFIKSSETYYGNKVEDLDRLNKLRFEMEFEVFSDTILILIYINDIEISKNDLVLYFTGIVAAEFFRSMLRKTGFLIRGAMSIGDYYLEIRNNRTIVNGRPMNEVAEYYEKADWGGIITAPNATSTIKQLDTLADFKAQLAQYETEDLNPNQKKILHMFEDSMNGLTGLNNYLIRYNIPWKVHLQCEGYAVAWPLIKDDYSDEIALKLENLIKQYKVHENTDTHYIYLKYKNTQLFHEHFKK